MTTDEKQFVPPNILSIVNEVVAKALCCKMKLFRGLYRKQTIEISLGSFLTESAKIYEQFTLGSRYPNYR